MKITNAQKLFLSATSLAIAATAVYTPTVQATQVKSFKDVPADHYAHEAITYMAANKIINGYNDNTYRPNKPVTRAQAAKMIALTIGAKPSHAYRMDFTDVTPANGAYEHIRALTEKGLFANQSKFNPNSSLTRGQMAKLLVLGFNIITDDNDFIRFADVAKSNGSYAYIISIAELNITTTRPGANFKPNHPVTRAQMAAFLYRAIEFDNKRKEGQIVYDKDKKAYIDRKPANQPAPPGSPTPAPSAPSAPPGSPVAPAPPAMAPKPVPPKPIPAPPTMTPNPVPSKPIPAPPAPPVTAPKPPPAPPATAPNPVPPIPEPQQPSLAAQTILATNAKRKAANINQLQADPALNRIAKAKAEDMAKNGELSHTSPTYGTPEELLKAFDYKYKEYGENIGAGFEDALEITDAWLAQSGEYKNILSPVFTHIGAGTATDKDGVIYWVNLYSQK
ncbi:S-layer homology domain-containing protein [Sporosarcina sp. GW1-11]|uniref:CAP and S-layer homology domain-containing protein n=1 Tax=Sporosarcina sp. GW1-11 TaxID=2899126 RepID=UPI00294EB423|nr:S-layer homology domain-containing protein [Sporosarcina sp. GW1-11]MDV6378233.1 S-layer homology domain-containing protein [Sporosarcina sp. GW1-11]